MAIEINAQFKQFVQFAEDRFQTGKQKAVARVNDTAQGLIPEDGADPLVERTIKAAKGDHVGPLWRSQGNQNANNYARTLFKQAIIDMFGSENAIPASVLDAMKMQDYDKGKPLTARRILAVKAAVEQAKGQIEQCESTIRTSAANIAADDNKVSPEAARARAETLIAAAGNDSALLGVLKNPKITSHILKNDNGLRSDDDITNRVGRLKENVDELRAATKGDRAMFAAGLRALYAFGGKVLPKGILTSIIDLAKTSDMSALANLKRNSGMAALHKGIVQFNTAVEEIILKSRVMTALPDSAGDERFSAQRLVGHILLAHMSDAEMNTIQDSLSGSAAGKLRSVYGQFLFPDQLPKDVFGKKVNVSDRQNLEMSNVSMGITGSLTLLKEITADAVGEHGELAKEIEVPIEDPIFGTVAPDVLRCADASIERKKQAIVSTFVSGGGQGSDFMRGIIVDNFTGTPNLGGVESLIEQRMSKNTNSMINWNIMTECRKLATGNVEDSQFAKDLGRMQNIKVGGQELSRDLKTALDQIARFVTKDENATYQGLNGEAKGKAHIVMSFITQEMSKAAETGAGYALSNDNNMMPFKVVANNVPGGDTRMSFDISFNEKGGLVVKHESVKPVRAVIAPGDEPSIEDMQCPTEGRTVTSSFTYTLGAREFNSLSKLDFTKFDDAKARQIEGEDAPDVLEKVAQSFGSKFSITGDSYKCKATFKAELG